MLKRLLSFISRDSMKQTEFMYLKNIFVNVVLKLIFQG